MEGSKFFNKQNQPILNLILLITLILGIYEKSPNYLLVENASEEVKLVKCIDGDTAEFTNIGKTRFLLIDTPESTTKVEPYGKKASNYTCNVLKKAKTITYEYDGDKKDKYGRSLAYIFVDGQLLQEMIAKEGYVKKLYLYKSFYKYETKVRNAINDKYEIWEGKKKG